MDSKTKEKELKGIMDKGLISGVWKLTYTLVNELGEQGFSGKFISSYSDPLTGRPRHMYNKEGNWTPGFLIDKTTMYLRPDQEIWHRYVIDWLVGHPEVGVDQKETQLSENYMRTKSDNPRIKLINLDYQEVVEYQEEDYIDKLVGRISLDQGKQSLGLEKLKIILSSLNLQYRDEKYITKADLEKQSLRKKLKDYSRASYKNAQKVNQVLDDLAKAKLLYEIKEMVRTELLIVSGGTFMYEGNPLGISTESVMKYFSANPDFYGEVLGELYKILKKEETVK
jgi:hypothetical protein